MRLKFLALVILLISLLVSGCGQSAQNEEKEEPDVVPVQVAAAEKDRLEEITQITGKLEAQDSSDVVPGGQGGKVKSVRVDTGDRVSRGETMVVLENSDLAASARQAEQGIVQAESGLETARIDYEQAKKNYERGKMLLEQGAIPQAQFERDYENPYLKAKEQYEKVAPSKLENAKASLQQAQKRYNDSFITSPLNGVVTSVNVSAGELAVPSAGPVVSVASLDKVAVEADVPEDLINELKTGDTVNVQVSAVAAEPFKGKITTIAPAASRQSKAFPVEVQLDNPEHKLKPGMFAEMNFVKLHPEHIVVPRDAVVGTAGEDVVWVVEDGKANRREVETGAGNSESVIILSGIKEGEKVVTAGMDSLQDGIQVDIKG